jgi:hypothetical protein
MTDTVSTQSEEKVLQAAQQFGLSAPTVYSGSYHLATAGRGSIILKVEDATLPDSIDLYGVIKRGGVVEFVFSAPKLNLYFEERVGSLDDLKEALEKNKKISWKPNTLLSLIQVALAILALVCLVAQIVHIVNGTPQLHLFGGFVFFTFVFAFMIKLWLDSEWARPELIDAALAEF